LFPPHASNYRHLGGGACKSDEEEKRVWCGHIPKAASHRFALVGVSAENFGPWRLLNRGGSLPAQETAMHFVSQFVALLLISEYKAIFLSIMNHIQRELG
jgi:hypothetical protein